MKFIIIFLCISLAFAQQTSRKAQQTDTFQLLSNHDLDFFRECSLKQGYLGVVSQKNQEKNSTIEPIFAILTPKFFSLFENESTTSLIKALDLKSLRILDSHQEIPQKTKKFSCFRVTNPETNAILSENAVISTISKNNSLTFCFPEETTRKAWVRAVRRFKRCFMENSKKMRENSRILSKISRVSPENPENIENSQSESQIDRELQQLKAEILRDKLHEEQTAAQLENSRRQIARKTRKLEQQQRILSKTLESKAIIEENLAETLIKQEEAVKRREIFEKTRRELFNESRKESSRIVEQEKMLLKAEKNLQEEIANIMVKTSYEFEKLMDFTNCSRKELTGGNSSYIKEMCTRFSQEKGEKSDKIAENLLACVDKNRFCEQCCHYFIGTGYESLRFKCRKGCDEVVFNKFSVKTAEAFVVTVPKQNQVLVDNNKYNVNNNSYKGNSSSGLSSFNYNNNSKNFNNSSYYSNSNSGFILDINGKIQRGTAARNMTKLL